MSATAPVAQSPATRRFTSNTTSDEFPLHWLALAHAPLWLVFCWHLWSRPHYQFAGLAIAAAYYFLYRALLAPRPETTPQRNLHLPLLAAGLALLAVAFVWHSYWLIGIALILQVFAVAYERFGWRCLIICMPTFGLLLLCVPPPFGLDSRILSTFQDISTAISCNVMDLLGIPYLKNGNVIVLTQKSLFVAEACSGVSFFFATLCCVFLWSGLYKLTLLETLGLLLLAPLWIIFGNVLRVMIVVWTTRNGLVDLTIGWKHDALGLFTFAICLFLTFNSRQLFLIVFPKYKKTRSVGSAARPTPGAAAPPAATTASEDWQPVTMPIRKELGKGLTLAALAVGVFFIAIYNRDFRGTMNADIAVIHKKLDTITNPDETHVSGMDEAMLKPPASTVDSWRLEHFTSERRSQDSIFGANSSIWIGSLGEYQATASVDYPFDHWHDLTICYRNQGWEVKGESQVAPNKELPLAIRIIKLERKGEKACLFFTHIDANGDPTEITKMQDPLGMTDRLLKPPLFFGQPRPPDRVYVQTQLLLGGTMEPDDRTQEKAIRLLNDLARSTKSKLQAK